MIEYENLYELNKRFATDYKNKVDQVLGSGQFILGKQVKEFENNFAAYCGSKFCIGVANGMDALTLALKSFSFESRAEVLVPSNTYIASILAILNANLTPVLVEPDIRTYTMDPWLLEQAISKNTVAIMPVHLYGKCCDMDRIGKVAVKYSLKIIEDCAQAHGAKFRNRKAGSFGDFGAFSFYPTKNLGALGDAGCLTTDDEGLNRIVNLLRNYGSGVKYYNQIQGMNSRLDELQAAFLSVKLEALDSINSHKRKLAAIYSAELKEDFIKPVHHDDYHDVFHIYNIRHSKRDKLRDYLLKSGIVTEIHYPVAPHQQEALLKLVGNKAYPISEEIHSTTLSLPISLIHSQDDAQKVVEVMNKF
ncbi:DegT/DnrJ/EryC1/StrS family aminotransferase [soil metagenome]